MQDTSPPRFGFIAVLSTVVILLLIIGLAVVGSLVQPAEAPQVEVFENPVEAIDPETIDPALAIAQLGGLAPVDVIDQAIRQSRPGTALATIVFNANISTQDAAGYLLLLGNTFIERGDHTRAKLAYQMAGNLATLSPDLSDTTRADVFLQAGNGLAQVDDLISAKIYFDQAFLLATESRYLQANYRSTVLSRLSEGYRRLELNTEARRALELSVDPVTLAAVPEAPLVLPVGQEISLPADIQQVEADRWQAAQLTVRDLVNTGGTAPPEVVQALAQNLMAEDALKTAYFETRLANAALLSEQVDILRTKINWQSTKYRIASGGFGLSIVPEWEANREQIRADLSASYAQLYRIYADIIVAIPEANDIDRATEEVLRRQILAGTLGYYPDFPQEALRAQILQASAQLIETQPGTKLRVSFLTVADTNYYVLISDSSLNEIN